MFYNTFFSNDNVPLHDNVLLLSLVIRLYYIFKTFLKRDTIIRNTFHNTTMIDS